MRLTDERAKESDLDVNVFERRLLVVFQAETNDELHGFIRRRLNLPAKEKTLFFRELEKRFVRVSLEILELRLQDERIFRVVKHRSS